MSNAKKARAGWRELFSAALLGSGAGFGLGAVFLAAGMAGHAAEHVEAQRMAEAASNGYAGSYLEAEGPGLRMGLERYGFRAGRDAETVAYRFAHDRGAAEARRRADLQCLTEAVYYEARGESARGQAAVAQVVLNRVRHPAFPKSVCGVVFQGAGRSGCQFSFTCDGSMRGPRELAAWERARDVAARTLAGVVVADIGKATHFHTVAVAPVWAPQMLRVAQVGAHIFYRVSPSVGRMPVMAEKAVLISAPRTVGPDFRVTPTIESAIAASLDAGAPEAKPAPAKPSEAAALVDAHPTAAVS